MLVQPFLGLNCEFSGDSVVESTAECMLTGLRTPELRTLLARIRVEIEMFISLFLNLGSQLCSQAAAGHFSGNDFNPFPCEADLKGD